MPPGTDILNGIHVVNGQVCPDVVRACIGVNSSFQSMSVLYTSMNTRVYLVATKTQPRVILVLKRYRRVYMTEKMQHQIMEEIHIHKDIAHHNVIAMYGAWSDAANVYIALEYAANGDLYTRIFLARIQAPPDPVLLFYCMPPNIVSTLLKDLLQTLDHVHALGVVHRDVKPENILLDASWGVKLADFGLAIDRNVRRPMTKFLGTCDYMAPEVIQSQYREYSDKVDIWATGVVAYEMLLGKPPFLADSEIAKLQRIVSDGVHLPTFVDPDIRSFIEAALSKRPDSRPSAAELLRFPWVSRALGTSSREWLEYLEQQNERGRGVDVSWNEGIG